MCMELFFSGNTEFICPTCGKVFETQEEFDNRHNKSENKDWFITLTIYFFKKHYYGPKYAIWTDEL